MVAIYFCLLAGICSDFMDMLRCLISCRIIIIIIIISYSLWHTHRQWLLGKTPNAFWAGLRTSEDCPDMQF